MAHQPQDFCDYEIDPYTYAIGSTLLQTFSTLKTDETKEFFTLHIHNMIVDAMKRNLPINQDALFLMCCHKNINFLVKFFVENGVNINAVSKFGSTCIMYAAENNNYDMVRFFVDSGVDIFVKNNSRMSAIDYSKPGSETRKYLYGLVNIDLKRQKELNEENEKLKQQLAEMEAKFSQMSHSDLPRKKASRSPDSSDEVKPIMVDASHFDTLMNNLNRSKAIPPSEVDMIQ